MYEVLTKFEQKFRKASIAKPKSGDTVRVHQVITEGGKERIQIFEGMVIRTHRLNSLNAVITVRRLASGVGVEKTFMLHSPTVKKVEVVRRSKVRRNYLSYMRERQGKSARLREIGFDRESVEARAEEPVVEEVAASEDVQTPETTEAPAVPKDSAAEDKADETATT